MGAAAVWLLAVAAAWAQGPEIRTGGVTNAASRTPSMLPGGAVARGALFEIAGVRLGTGTRTTSVTVSARGKTWPVPLLAVSPQRIDGRMPEEAPLGDVALLVTVDGVAGAAYALKVASAGFGIFSRNREGWGPGRVDNQASDGSRSPNAPRHAASPGQAMVLWGTGLGTAPPEVWVGSRRATVSGVRRGRAGGDGDEIAFRLPPGSPAGCYVPLQVRAAGAVPSNTVTVSVHGGGGACEPPAVLPVAAWSGRSGGLVAISRTARPPDSLTDEGRAVFARREDRDAAPSQILSIPPVGTCTAYTGAAADGQQPSASLGDAPLASAHSTGLDAGGRITVALGGVLKPVTPVPGAPGLYKRLLGEARGGRPGRGGPPFLQPGTVVVAGEGGADVGAFAVPVAAPEPLVWENRDTIGAVDRRTGVTLRWRPVAQPGVVLIGLAAVDGSAAAWGACYCAAAAAAGSFTVPPAMLANLPASQPSPTVPAPTLSLSYLPFRNQQPFHARGLDDGLAISLFVEAVEVAVR